MASSTSRASRANRAASSNQAQEESAVWSDTVADFESLVGLRASAEKVEREARKLQQKQSNGKA